MNTSNRTSACTQGHDASALTLHKHVYYQACHRFLKKLALDLTHQKAGQAPVTSFHLIDLAPSRD